MYKEDVPVTQNFLLGKIGHKFDKLRKLNGSKYRVCFLINSKKLLKKTNLIFLLFYFFIFCYDSYLWFF